MTKTLAAMLNDRNKKSLLQFFYQWSSNMAAMTSVANDLYHRKERLVDDNTMGIADSSIFLLANSIVALQILGPNEK